MTQKDIDWVFEWTQVILEQTKWCQKVGKEKVMEMTRQSLERYLGKLIVPCGSSRGALQEPDSKFNDYWKQQDEELKKQYFEDIKPFDKYWVNYER